MSRREEGLGRVSREEEGLVKGDEAGGRGRQKERGGREGGQGREEEGIRGGGRA